MKSITDDIVMGMDREELMDEYNLAEGVVATIQKQVNRALEDQSISEEEFFEICKEIDEEYR